MIDLVVAMVVKLGTRAPVEDPGLAWIDHPRFGSLASAHALDDRGALPLDALEQAPELDRRLRDLVALPVMLPPAVAVMRSGERGCRAGAQCGDRRNVRSFAGLAGEEITFSARRGEGAIASKTRPANTRRTISGHAVTVLSRVSSPG